MNAVKCCERLFWIGCATLALTAMAAASGCGAREAYAEDGQTGTGETSLVVKVSDGSERGGTNAEGDLANPDRDGDGVGDNLAFTVPIRIDFVVLSNGDVVGPQQDAVYIRNESYFGIRVSSLVASPKNGWNIVEDASEEVGANAIDLMIGPDANQLSMADYREKAEVSVPKEWNMAAKSKTEAGGKVVLHAAGHVNNVRQDIAKETTFGQINWYVKPGQAS